MRKNAWDEKRGIWQPVLSEEHVLREIVARLWWAKIKVWRIRERIPGQGRLSTAGIPDLIGVGPGGRAIFLEVKRPKGRHRLSQELFIDEVKKAGAVAGFVDSWSSVVDLFGTCGIKLEYDRLGG